MSRSPLSRRFGGPPNGHRLGAKFGKLAAVLPATCFSDFSETMLDAAVSPVIISTAELIRPGPPSARPERTATMICPHYRCTCRLLAIRLVCVALAAMLVWQVSISDANAGLILSSLSKSVPGAREAGEPEQASCLGRYWVPYGWRHQVAFELGHGGVSGGMGGASSPVGTGPGTAILYVLASSAELDFALCGRVSCSHAGKPVRTSSDLLKPPKIYPLHSFPLFRLCSGLFF